MPIPIPYLSNEDRDYLERYDLFIFETLKEQRILIKEQEEEIKKKEEEIKDLEDEILNINNLRIKILRAFYNSIGIFRKIFRIRCLKNFCKNNDIEIT